MATKLDIKDVLLALDKKDRGFYDRLSDEEKKAFSPYMMIRWGCSVQGISDLQEYYLIRTNENYNKNFFDVSSSVHPKLHWLTATTISPGMGKQYHPWLSAPKKQAKSKLESFFISHYPTMKLDEIRLLIQTNTPDDIKAFLKDLGKDDKEIKEIMK